MYLNNYMCNMLIHLSFKGMMNGAVVCGLLMEFGSSGNLLQELEEFKAVTDLR